MIFLFEIPAVLPLQFLFGLKKIRKLFSAGQKMKKVEKEITKVKAKDKAQLNHGLMFFEITCKDILENWCEIWN